MTEAPVSTRPKDKRAGFIRNLYDWLEAAVFSFSVVVILFTFVFRVVGVGGISMENTLNEGVVNETQFEDRLIISSLGFPPKRGDIVVLHSPAAGSIIKRVIAVGGDTVDIDYRRHLVYLNGQPLTEPYVREPTALEGDVGLPEKIPAGYLFVMGDNRNSSYDSRFSAIGLISVRDVIGKAVLRVYPLSRFGFLS